MSVKPQIIVNGEAHPWRTSLSLLELIEELGLTGKRLAVELNGDIVPRSQHAKVQLAAQDRVEIVQAIGGG